MTTENKAKISDYIADAVQAMDTLNAARREACAEYNERIRKLRDFVVSMMSARAGAQGELFDIGATVTPEIDRLMKDPTHHL